MIVSSFWINPYLHLDGLSFMSFTDSDESFNPESGAEDQNLKEE